jgi:Helix-turn-helix domain
MNITSKSKKLLAVRAYPVLWAAGYVTVNEAAEILSCSLRTLRYRQAQGEMPPRHRRGRFMIYRRADIASMVREHI